LGSGFGLIKLEREAPELGGIDKMKRHFCFITAIYFSKSNMVFSFNIVP
jgi:hypothetical protein